MLTIDFGAEGNSAGYASEGWSAPERGFRWMTGTQSGLRIEKGLSGDCILELDLHGFKGAGLMVQRLSVTVNGRLLGRSNVASEGRVGYLVPAAVLVGSDGTSVVFDHPDGARPFDYGLNNDTRLLSLCVKRMKVSPVPLGVSGQAVAGNGGIALAQVERITGLDPARLMLEFESLGNNCEFGIAQKSCGADAFFSLLRFAGMELPTLLRALDLGMEDFGDSANVEIRLDDKPRREFLTHENRYGVFFHTNRFVDETQPELLHASESKRMVYCAHRFLEELRSGSKILVVKRNEALREEEILPLYAALSCYGPNVLLWVVPADVAHPPGSVEVVLPGLLKGYIDRFAPGEHADDLSLSVWLEVCANAYQLSRDRFEVPAPPRARRISWLSHEHDP